MKNKCVLNDMLKGIRSRMTGKPRTFVILLFQRQETRRKDSAGHAHTQT